MSGSEELRGGPSSHVALGKSREGNRVQTPEMRQERAPAGSEPEDRSLDNTRHVYMCNSFKEKGSEIKSLGELCKKSISQFTFN